LWLLALPQSLGGSHGDDGVRVEVNQLCRQFIKGRGTAISVLDLDVLPFDIAEFTKPRKQCIDQMRDASRREISEPIGFHRLLPARRKRPRCRAAESRDELAPVRLTDKHQISSPWRVIIARRARACCRASSPGRRVVHCS
jgi:hypothetical protein